MITLGNLKTGQTKVLDNGVTVTKEDGHYKVVTTQGVASLRFLKDEREWRFVIDAHGDVEYHLPEGTTGKTAVEVLIANWPAAPAPVEAPVDAPPAAPKDKRESALKTIQTLLAKGNDPTLTPAESEAYLGRAAALMAKHSIEAEELRRAEGGEAGEGDDEIITWSFQVDNQGGHAQHRAHSYMSVVRAFGAGTFFTHTRYKGLGYKHDRVIVYAIAQSAIIDKIKEFVVIMELAMERQAAVISRAASSHSRATGGHHSLAGCRARRGFIRGFGDGIADRLTAGTTEVVQEDETGSKALVLADRKAQVEAYMAQHHGNLKAVKVPAYDRAAYAQGRERGRSFASPAVQESPATERETISA